MTRTHSVETATMRRNMRTLSAIGIVGAAGCLALLPTIAWAEDKLRIAVIDHWWQTEIGWPIGANCLGIERLPVKHGSCTRAVPGWDIRVLDAEAEAEGTAREVGTREIGALAVKLPLPAGALATLWQVDEAFV